MPTLRFDAPDLPLVVAGFVFVWLAILGLEARADGTRSRRVTRAAVRSLLLLCVALALAGPSIREEENATRRLIVLVDRRARAIEGGQAAAADLLTRARATAARTHAVLDVLEFDAAVTVAHSVPAGDPKPTPPAPRSAPPENAAGTASAERSRLSPALAAAALRVTDDESATIVVATDGRADATGALAETTRLAERGIAVRAVAIPPGAAPIAKHPVIDALDVPDLVRSPFAVRASVRDAASGSTAALWIDGKPVEGTPRPLSAEGEASFDDVVLAPGFHDVAVVVTDPSAPESDGARSILSRSLVRVAAPPRALVVGTGAIGAVLRQTLSSQGFATSIVGPGDAAEALASDGALDLVVLDADVAPSVTTAFHNGVLARVKAGLGFWVAAGTSSEAWATLGRGPLAALLPLLPLDPPVVQLPPAPPPPTDPPRPAPPDADDKPDEGPGIVADPRPEKALPITLLLVIDRSGSMQIEGKLGMAIRAAEEAGSTLAPSDRVGVISFSDRPTLDTAITSAGIANALGLVPPLVADGDTDIFSALALAAQVMAPETSPIRHVLLLTDGNQTGSAYFNDLIQQMADARITLTTVGLGQDVNEFKLKMLARLGNGRFFYAATPQDLPRVLTRDTRAVVTERSERAARERLARMNDRAHLPPPRPTKPDEPAPAGPVVPPPPPPSMSKPPPPIAPLATVAPSPLLRRRHHEALLGISPATYPQVGMPRTSKPASPTSVILVRQTGEAVLAAGRAGLGRVIVLALPVTDPGFVGWTDATRLVAQAARSVAAPSSAGPEAVVRVTRGPDGDQLRVAVPEGVDRSAIAARIRVRRRDASGEAAATVVEGDGGDVVFALPASESDMAEVLVEASPEEGGEPRPLPPIAYLPSKGPAPLRGADPETLSTSLGGRLRTSDDALLFEVPTKRTSTHLPLTPWLAALAVLLLPIDVAVHRRGRPS